MLENLALAHAQRCFLEQVIYPNIRQSRPDYGKYKTVKARSWHIKDSQGQIMAHTRQSRPASGPDWLVWFK
jgi:hypothetical protein